MEEPEVWYAHRLDTIDGTVVDLGPDPVPQRIIDHVQRGGEIRAHNAPFERIMWKYVAGPRYGWPGAKLEQFVDSAAEAAAMSLPRSLGQLAEVLGLDQQKDDEGHRLMMRMSRPRRIEEDGTIVWWDDPERLARLAAYCQQDVRTERRAAGALRRLTPKEREVYLLTERMNDRGMQIDRELIAAAKDVVTIGVDRANEELKQITGGAVSSVTKVAEIRDWLETQGVLTDSISKARVRELLDADIPDVARQVLELRATAGRSSVAKLDTMETCMCSDGRARGLTMYHGAGTGRWTGKLIQPHNFPRGEIDDVESYIPFMLERQHDIIEMMHPPIIVVSSMLRSMLTATPGHELMVADYSAIEARVLNWIAGQNDMLNNFRLYDAGDKTRDPYIRNAMNLFRLPYEQIEKFPHRQTGKFQELGCGYGMGWKKAVSAAKDVYGLTITEDFAREVVNGYRATHGSIVDYWALTNDAAIEAVSNPGRPVSVITSNAKVTFVKAGPYMYIILPSGRPLAYPDPKVVLAPTPWGEDRWAVEFSGVHPLTRQWVRQRLYGGLIVENIVQAASRDLLAEGKLRAEAAGYKVIMSVHDEAISEVPEGFGSVKEYESILSATPEWARGCPVAAEGWRGFRYRK